MNLETTIKELYESEIRFGIYSVHSGGRGWVDADMGSDEIGLPAEEASFDFFDAEKIAEWLKSTAIQLYPESEFARKYK